MTKEEHDAMKQIKTGGEKMEMYKKFKQKISDWKRARSEKKHTEKIIRESFPEVVDKLQHKTDGWRANLTNSTCSFWPEGKAYLETEDYKIAASRWIGINKDNTKTEGWLQVDYMNKNNGILKEKKLEVIIMRDENNPELNNETLHKAKHVSLEQLSNEYVRVVWTDKEGTKHREYKVKLESRDFLEPYTKDLVGVWDPREHCYPLDVKYLDTESYEVVASKWSRNTYHYSPVCGRVYDSNNTFFQLDYKNRKTGEWKQSHFGDIRVNHDKPCYEISIGQVSDHEISIICTNKEEKKTLMYKLNLDEGLVRLKRD